MGCKLGKNVQIYNLKFTQTFILTSFFEKYFSAICDFDLTWFSSLLEAKWKLIRLDYYGTTTNSKTQNFGQLKQWNCSDHPCPSLKDPVCSGEADFAIHVRRLYPRLYFMSPSERTLCFLFLWFGQGWAVGRGEQPNPNVDAQLGSLSTECPDQTKAGREMQGFIYIH